MNSLTRKFKSLGLMRRRKSAAPDLEVVNEISAQEYKDAISAQEFAAAVGMEIVPDEEDLPILSSSSNTSYSIVSSSSTTSRKYSFPPLDMSIFIPPEQDCYEQGGIKTFQKGRFQMSVQKSSHFYARPRKRSRTLSGSRFELVNDVETLSRPEKLPLSKSF